MSRSTKIFILIAFFCLLFFTSTQKVSAVSAAEWNPGRIIDDSIFYVGGEMPESEIQNFLNAKVPVCDTNGTQPYAGTTRAAYSATKGYPPPFTCLKSYSENISGRASDQYCSTVSPGTKSSAAIIKEVSQACGISSRALIVLLEKEQGLVTDDWPWPLQYRSATGYGCPDTAACDAEYYGFFNQVYNAARQFKNYSANQASFRYKAFQNNAILYNPNTSCGSSNVYIENKATAGLYNYTPYQPNPSALTNLYGIGDGCGAYGNRNFWRLFNDWFGSTRINCALVDVGNRVYRLYNPDKHDYLYTTNSTEVCLAEGLYGYLRDGFAFKNTDPTTPGALPVYRLSTPGGGHFYTMNELEKTYTISTGFVYEGVAYYAQPGNTPNYSPVYRLRGQFGQHFYTNSESERDYFISNYGFANEGVVYYAPNNTDVTANVYRLLKPNGQHFYTSSTAEKDYLVTYSGFRMESIEFTGLNDSNGLVIPVYRLVSGGTHKITSSPEERNTLTKIGYKNEGIAFYMPPANPSSKPAYRIYRKTDGDHMYTASPVEKNVLISNPIFIYEGIGFSSF